MRRPRDPRALSRIRLINCKGDDMLSRIPTLVLSYGLYGIAALCFLGAGTAAAQVDDGRSKAAHRLVQALELDASLERLAFRQTASAADSASIARLQQFLAKYLDVARLRDSAASQYARSMTTSELTALAGLFESDLGKKYLALQPHVADALQPILSAVFREHMSEFQREVLRIP